MLNQTTGMFAVTSEVNMPVRYVAPYKRAFSGAARSGLKGIEKAQVRDRLRARNVVVASRGPREEKGEAAGGVRY